MRDTVLPHQDACPFCAHQLDRVMAGPTNPNAVPKPDDFTVCIQCGGVLVFGPDLKVRPPTPAEHAEAEATPHLVAMVLAIGKLGR